MSSARLNTVPAYARVTRIEWQGAAAASSSSAPPPRTLKLTFQLLPEWSEQINGDEELFYLTFNNLRYHLKDAEVEYCPPSMPLHISRTCFTMTFKSKGSIKAVCLAMIRAIQNPEEGYGGLLVSPEHEEKTREIYNGLVSTSKPSVAATSQTPKEQLSGGTILKRFGGASAPVLIDFGAQGQWVVRTNIGTLRVSSLIQVGIDKMVRTVVNPELPETRIIYDEAGHRQGYASQFTGFTNLYDYLLEHRLSPDRIASFLAANAEAFGQVAAQAMFTGNVDVLTTNLAVRGDELIGLFDNDRAIFQVFGKYHGFFNKPSDQVYGAINAINQRSLRTPADPVGMDNQAWFYGMANWRMDGMMPLSIEKEYITPGLHRLMQDNPAFKRGYFQTLYAFSRLQRSHIMAFFSHITNERLRSNLVFLFTQQAQELTKELWSWPEFYDYYFAHQSEFEAKLSSIHPEGEPLSALTTDNLDYLMFKSLHAKLEASINGNQRLMDRLYQLDLDKNDSTEEKPRSYKSLICSRAGQIRFLTTEQSIVNDLLTQSRLPLDDTTRQALQRYNDFISEKISTYYEEINPDLHSFDGKNPVIELSDYLESVVADTTISYTVFESEFREKILSFDDIIHDFDLYLRILDILQTDDYFSLIERFSQISQSLVTLMARYNRCSDDLLTIQPDDLNTSEACDDVLGSLNFSISMLDSIDFLRSVRMVADHALRAESELFKKTSELCDIKEMVLARKSQIEGGIAPLANC